MFIPQELLKMPLFDVLSNNELNKLFFTLFFVLIVCVAWWTTGITEPPQIRTIFLVERRRPHHRRNLTTHVQSSSIQASTVETTTGENQVETLVSEENKPPEAGTSTSNSPEPAPAQPQTVEEQESQDIVRIMDTDTDVVRQRRLAFLENRQQRGTQTKITIPATTASDCNDSSPASDNLLNEEEPIMEHNYAERDQENQGNSIIRIKLKYLNDDLKLVDGRLEELLGDFKRRHFEMELSSNKLVRLIFNGQVLQSDQETLRGCGMFDNCVVHCLVHQQRAGANPTDGAATDGRLGATPISGNSSQGRDWDFGNLLFITVSVLLLSAWYFRYEYAHMYTVTATVALVAITGIFTILLVGLYFPDQEPARPRVEVRS